VELTYTISLHSNLYHSNSSIYFIKYENTMTIIYFHGYGSSSNSTTGNALKARMNCKVICTNYNTQDADDAFEQLNKVVSDEINAGDEILLLGNSLGGFWASYFAGKYHKNLLLINPCMDPIERMKFYIALGHNIAIETYANYPLISFGDIEKNVILGKLDDTIPYESYLELFEKENFKIHFFDTMQHRVENHINDVLEIVEALIKK